MGGDCIRMHEQKGGAGAAAACLPLPAAQQYTVAIRLERQQCALATVLSP